MSERRNAGRLAGQEREQLLGGAGPPEQFALRIVAGMRAPEIELPQRFAALRVVSVISSSKAVGETPWRRNTERQRRMKLAWRSCLRERLSEMRPGSPPSFCMWR